MTALDTRPVICLSCNTVIHPTKVTDIHVFWPPACPECGAATWSLIVPDRMPR